MSATWLNTGIDFAAQVFLNKTGQQNLTTRLYTNNVTPAVTDTASTYTECALSGYSASACSPGSWTGSTSGGLATYVYPAITFTFAAYAGGTTIYGYFVTIPGLIGVLAELLATPFAVPAGGGTLTVTPTYQDRKF